MMKYDMHVHTIYSDGVLKPSQIINMAVSNKINGIAITDHDTTDGIEDAFNFKDKGDLDIIPGIELSATMEGNDIHILGYWIDYRNINLLARLSEIKEVRIERIEKMVKNLYDIARIKIDIDEVLREGNYYTLGRPHIARVLVMHGYADSISDAFKRYLNKNSQIYVEKYKLTPEEAVKIILDANGAPVLAHPGLIDNKELIPKIIEAGVYGIEVYHPKHHPEDVNFAHEYAEMYNLVETGGSDFHSPEDDIIGECTISNHNVIKLKEKIKSVREVF
ncbi:MAG: PHP domain-containing protein [Thermoanaerobacteraceae bacterium]|nr:PHP domain-containing protein [Thermoanaerobacteraceae bacterium]